MGTIHGCEKVAGRADALRSAEYQKAAGPRGIVKQRNHFSLQDRFQINQQIPATNQIHLGEWRVAQDVMLSKDAQVPDALADPVTAFNLAKEPAQPLGRDISLDIVLIYAASGATYVAFTYVRPEELNRIRGSLVAQIFQ